MRLLGHNFIINIIVFIYNNRSVLEVMPDVIDKEKAVAYGIYNNTVSENG